MARYTCAAAFEDGTVRQFETLDELLREAKGPLKRMVEQTISEIEDPQPGHEITVAELRELRRSIRKYARRKKKSVRSHALFREAHDDEEGPLGSSYAFRAIDFGGGPYLPIVANNFIPDLSVHGWNNCIRSAYVIGRTIFYENPSYGGQSYPLFGPPPNGLQMSTLGWFNDMASSVKHWD
jgi:hypothetical protein